VKDGFDCRGVLRTPMSGRAQLAPAMQGAQKLRSRGGSRTAPTNRYAATIHPVRYFSNGVFPLNIRGFIPGLQEPDFYLTGQG